MRYTLKLHNILMLMSMIGMLQNFVYAADPSVNMVSNAPRPFLNSTPVIRLPLDRPDQVENTLIRPSPIGKLSKESNVIENETPEFIKSQQANVSKAKDIPIVISQDANTAISNINMVTNTPGRQDPANYPRFLIESTGKIRECILSGFERRRVIDASGQETYQGTLPSLRMVAADISDIPSWHPPESDCIISISSDEGVNN